MSFRNEAGQHRATDASAGTFQQNFGGVRSQDNTFGRYKRPNEPQYAVVPGLVIIGEKSLLVERSRVFNCAVEGESNLPKLTHDRTLQPRTSDPHRDIGLATMQIEIVTIELLPVSWTPR